MSGFANSDFAGTAIDQIHAMIFTSQAWQMIPFQVDERDSSGSYFTADQTAGLDANDELVFMAADAGDSGVGKKPRIAADIQQPVQKWRHAVRAGENEPVETVQTVQNRVDFVPILRWLNRNRRQ